MSTSNSRGRRRTPSTIPGPRSRDLAKRLAAVESRNVTYQSREFPVFWESARGATVMDVDGHKYIDFTSAFGVSSLGHGAPAVRNAALRQMRKIMHGMGDVHPNAVKVDLLEALADITPGDLKVSILSSSGAEAVESALKTARLYTGKPGVVSFHGAYHGLTYGALVATDRRDFRDSFVDQLAPVSLRLPFPGLADGPDDEAVLDRLERALANPKATPRGAIGAVLLEPVQGRGGVRAFSAGFLQRVRALTRERGVVLIADEIYSGFGRTGTLFAIEAAGVVPDLLCVGKALANGFPLSACIGTEDVMSAWPASDGEAIHTSTFLGHPVGCAMALAAMTELRSRGLAMRARRMGAAWLEQLRATLKDHPHVGDIRGYGLMVGLDVVTSASSRLPDRTLAGRIVTEALRRGLLILSGGNRRNVLTLTPPLTISEAELRRGTQLLKETLDGTIATSD